MEIDKVEPVGAYENIVEMEVVVSDVLPAELPQEKGESIEQGPSPGAPMKSRSEGVPLDPLLDHERAPHPYPIPQGKRGSYREGAHPFSQRILFSAPRHQPVPQVAPEAPLQKKFHEDLPAAPVPDCVGPPQAPLFNQPLHCGVEPLMLVQKPGNGVPLHPPHGHRLPDLPPD